MIKMDKHFSELIRAILNTIGLVILYRLFLLIPLPFIDHQFYEELISRYNPEKTPISFSIAVLGIGPYIIAYSLVELSSLVVPFFRRLRLEGGNKGRRQLKNFALFATLIIGILMAFGIIKGISEIKLNGGSILPIQNGLDYVVPVVTLVGGVFLIIFIAELITNYGIGHGISILVLMGPVANVFKDFLTIFKEYKLQLGIYQVNGMLLLNIIPYLLFIVLGFVFLNGGRSVPLKQQATNSPVDYFQLNLNPSGVVSMSPSILLIALWPHRIIQADISRGGISHRLILFLLLLTISSLLAWAFFHPEKRIKKLIKQGWTLFDLEIPELLTRVILYNFPWICFVYYVQTMPDILRYFFKFDFVTGGMSLIYGFAVMLDVIDRMKFSRNIGTGKSIKVAEIHDVYEAQMFKRYLEEAGIRCHLRGYHHRSMLYFFGPFIEISLMISDDNKVRTQVLLEDFNKTKKEK